MLTILIAPVLAISPVLLLLRSGGPSAVSRLIVSKHVYSVDRVVQAWPFTHVGQEVVKALKPAVADGDVHVLRPFGTPVLHSLPALVCGANTGLSGNRVFPAVTVTQVRMPVHIIPGVAAILAAFFASVRAHAPKYMLSPSLVATMREVV